MNCDYYTPLRFSASLALGAASFTLPLPFAASLAIAAPVAIFASRDLLKEKYSTPLAGFLTRAVVINGAAVMAKFMRDSLASTDLTRDELVAKFNGYNIVVLAWTAVSGYIAGCAVPLIHKE